ncbi:MAG: YdcF family protein [Terracidiphilus sp.]
MDFNTRDKSISRNSVPLVLLVVLVLLAMVAGGWSWWVYAQIESYAGTDQAAPADAIGVFGAAEYDGKPSPVYRARLDHALELYKRKIAPLIITLGGAGGDDYSEGAVGREYLMGAGVPAHAIIAETVSRNTEDSARRIAVIARTNNLRRLVIVSDGTHLFRIHEICAADGLDVLTSPRPQVPVEGGASGNTGEFERMAHEILSYTAWRLHLH